MGVRRRLSALLASLAAAATAASTATAVVPPGFTDSLLTAVAAPTALAFTPDGRMLVTTQPGELRVYAGGSLLPTPALTLGSDVCTNSERGLLGVAVPPDFGPSNRSIYLYYTARVGGSCVNRVSRFLLGDDNVVPPASQIVLVDNIHSTAGNHNGGDLQFGRDGLLYAGVGDGGCDYAGNSGCAGSNDAARDRHVLLGKILRIAPDGSIPAGNPYVGPGTARCNVTGQTTPGTVCQETYAWGLRNPFRLVFDPNAAGTRFFVNDVGQNDWEEIDLGQAGADYGWNAREGHCRTGSQTDCGPPPAGMTNPVFDYSHTTGCGSITGGAFVPNGLWPVEYNDDYLFGDYVCGKIFRLQASGTGGYVSSEFATGLGSNSAVAMAFGSSGTGPALHYTTYAGGGQVRRISHAGSANRAPAAAILTPAEGARFRVGEAVTLSGSGTDPEDGPLPASRLAWRVTRHHGTAHTHPWLQPTTGTSVAIETPAPEDLDTTTTSFLEVELTATDSLGVSTTVRRTLLPRVVDLTFSTRPAGLALTVNGERRTAPWTVASWSAWGLPVAAEWQHDGRGRPWAPASWSDGGAPAHAVLTPDGPAAYTARFEPAVQLASIRHRARSLNGEWVRLLNVGDREAELTGWTLRDGDGRTYRFGRFVLAPGRTVTLHTGRGRNGAAHLYWRRGQPVWDDRRDRATLRTSTGAVVDGCAYGRSRSRTTRC